MSNSLAIAAVTATLRSILSQVADEVPGTVVTARAPDLARNAMTGNQLNVFLYHQLPNAALRNQELPSVRAGEVGRIPLAVNLYYLLSAYGDNDDEVLSQSILGRAMSILLDRPVLRPADIQAALPGSGLHDQVERVRMTPHSLSVEDVTKLWVAFQAPLRASVAYQASVVLIESELGVRAALPVLRRGSEDRGAVAFASPSPTLTAVTPDVGRPGLSVAARLGDDLVVEGDNLDQGQLTARFTRDDGDPVVLPTAAGRGSTLRVHLPGPVDDPAALTRWAPGYSQLALLVARPEWPVWSTNAIPVALAPVVTVSPATHAAGDFTLQITCSPRLRAGQRALLLFGDRLQLPPDSVTNPADTSLPSTVEFGLTGIVPGTYVVRLRVDGVDSLPISMPFPSAPAPLAFDSAQQVVVT